MKLLLKTFFSRDSLPLFIVLVFGVLAGRTLIFQSGYFNMHDDLQMMRQLEMEKCFSDGQIPCRWVPDMGYGFGFPLFNFYPPLPYLIGEIFRIFGYSFVTAVKLNFALTFIVSGVTMFLLAKEFFGRVGGVLSAVFYIWAPYHAVDVYVRGALNESWALALFPVIFWSSYRLITSEKKEVTRWVVVLALAYFGLLTSHNLMVMVFTPLFGFWVLLILWQRKAWLRLPHLLISGIWALGLAAFFTLPALAENRFTQVKSQLIGYYDYTAHFVSLRQLLISRFWGFGPSVWVEAEDRMSFQIGHVHWILSLIVGFLMALRLFFKKGNILQRFKDDSILLFTSFMFAAGWLSAFLTHLKSIWIYQKIPQLGYIQFPWRFLTLVIFAFSFIVGAFPGVLSQWKKNRGFLVKLFSTPPQLFFFFVLTIIILVLNWGYFLPEGGKMGPLTDAEKFTGAAWDLQQTAGIYDYLPIAAETAPKSPQKELAEFMEGEGVITSAEQGTYWAFFKGSVESQNAKVRINIFQFPGWKVYVDGREVETSVPQEEKWGRMWIEVPIGAHEVYAQFFNTPVRTYANSISLISWVILILFLIRKKIKNPEYKI